VTNPPLSVTYQVVADQVILAQPICTCSNPSVFRDRNGDLPLPAVLFARGGGMFDPSAVRRFRPSLLSLPRATLGLPSSNLRATASS